MNGDTPSMPGEPTVAFGCRPVPQDFRTVVYWFPFCENCQNRLLQTLYF